MSHTPTPWTKGKHGDMRAPDGRQVTTYGLNIAAVMSSPSEEDRANSAFIIKAVNAHEGLVATLQKIAKRAHYLSEDTVEDMKRDLYHCEMLAISALDQIGVA